MAWDGDSPGRAHSYGQSGGSLPEVPRKWFTSPSSNVQNEGPSTLSVHIRKQAQGWMGLSSGHQGLLATSPTLNPAWAETERGVC